MENSALIPGNSEDLIDLEDQLPSVNEKDTPCSGKQIDCWVPFWKCITLAAIFLVCIGHAIQNTVVNACDFDNNNTICDTFKVANTTDVLPKPTAGFYFIAMILFSLSFLGMLCIQLGILSIFNRSTLAKKKLTNGSMVFYHVVVPFVYVILRSGLFLHHICKWLLGDIQPVWLYWSCYIPTFIVSFLGLLPSNIGEASNALQRLDLSGVTCMPSKPWVHKRARCLRVVSLISAIFSALIHIGSITAALSDVCHKLFTTEWVKTLFQTLVFAMASCGGTFFGLFLLVSCCRLLTLLSAVEYGIENADLSALENGDLDKALLPSSSSQKDVKDNCNRSVFNSLAACAALYWGLTDYLAPAFFLDQFPLYEGKKYVVYLAPLLTSMSSFGMCLMAYLPMWKETGRIKRQLSNSTGVDASAGRDFFLGADDATLTVNAPIIPGQGQGSPPPTGRPGQGPGRRGSPPPTGG